VVSLPIFWKCTHIEIRSEAAVISVCLAKIFEHNKEAFIIKVEKILSTGVADRAVPLLKKYLSDHFAEYFPHTVVSPEFRSVVAAV